MATATEGFDVPAGSAIPANCVGFVSCLRGELRSVAELLGLLLVTCWVGLQPWIHLKVLIHA